jgi:hypothetical protein
MRMTAEILNLRREKKRRARAEKEAAAAENRKIHGLTKAERRHDEANKALQNKKLDGLRRDTPGTADDE